jgi:hypothetical protein
LNKIQIDRKEKLFNTVREVNFEPINGANDVSYCSETNVSFNFGAVAGI